MSSNPQSISRIARAGAIFIFICMLGTAQAKDSGAKPRSFIIKDGQKVICIEIKKDVCINCKREPVALDGYKPWPTDEPCPMYDNSKENAQEEKSIPKDEEPEPQKGREQISGN